MSYFKLLNKNQLAVVVFLILILGGPQVFALQSLRGEYGGVLRVAFMSDMDTQNVLYQQSWWSYIVTSMCYDTLVVFDPGIKVTPWLATRWNVSSDGLVWTFEIVRNASWHDGVPLTSEDVAFTFNYIKEKKVAAFISRVEFIDHVEAVDKYTVRFYLSEKSATFLTRTLRSIPILPKHIWGSIEKPEEFKNDKFIGSGMFIFEERVPEQYIRLRTNEKYWRGRPYIDGVIIKIYKDVDSMIMALRAGEVDVVPWYSPTAVIPELEADPNIVIDNSPDYYVYITYFNIKKHPLDVKEFRHALAYATNREEIVKTIIGVKYGEPQYSLIASALEFWYNPNLPKYRFNMTKAKEILDKLGYRDTNGDGVREDEYGKPIEIEINPPNYDPVRIRAAQLMQLWWTELGLRVSVVPLDFDTVVDKAWVKHDFCMVIIGDGDLDPDYMLSTMCSWEYVEHGLNCMGYNSSLWDQLYREQRSEVNLDKRREIVWRMQEIFADELPMLPLYMQYCTYPYRTDTFVGYVPFPSGIVTDVNPWTWLKIHKVVKPTPTTPITTPTATLTPTVIPATPVTTPAPPAAPGLEMWIIVVAVVIIVILAIAAIVRRK